jgi:hypothetical protein
VKKEDISTGLRRETGWPAGIPGNAARIAHRTAGDEQLTPDDHAAIFRENSDEVNDPL